jgi:hypothetical protein
MVIADPKEVAYFVPRSSVTPAVTVTGVVWNQVRSPASGGP